MHERESKMAALVYYWYYRPFADMLLTVLDMVNISFISLVSVNFPSLSHIHALSMGLTTFGIILTSFCGSSRPHSSARLFIALMMAQFRAQATMKGMTSSSSKKTRSVMSSFQVLLTFKKSHGPLYSKRARGALS